VSLTAARGLDDLLALMAALRAEAGCAWDRAQTHRSIAPYAIEEAYELVEAIERDDTADMRDELGDVLLQVVFHAQMAREAGRFDFRDVVETLSAKLIRRHPHVFGAAATLDADAVKAAWARIKADERAARGERAKGLLDDVPVALPAQTRALKLQAKASSVGFDWNDVRLVLAKAREELDEIEHALDAGDHAAAAAEVGDAQFALVNLARHLQADPEATLRATNTKFARRFAFIEAELARSGRTLDAATLAEMDVLWDEAKTAGL